MGIYTVKNFHAVVNLKNIDDVCTDKKTGCFSRNWTDSSISLDKRQIKESRAGWQSLLSSSRHI